MDTTVVTNDKKKVNPVYFVEYNGERAPLKTMCRKLGVNYNTTKDRMLKHGMSFEEAVTVPVKKAPRFVAFGVTRTMREHCEFYRINYETVRSRMDKGLTLEQALITPLNHARIRPVYDYRGVRGGIGKICREFGVSYQTVHYKMNNGMSLEEAMDSALNKLHKVK